MAWRRPEPIAFLPEKDSPALKLAHYVAGAAAFLASLNDPLYTSVLDHIYYGEHRVTDRLAEACEARLHDGAMEEGYRGNMDGFEYENEDLYPNELRLARRIVGRDLRSIRDRLMLRMMGRGRGAGAIVRLRLETLDVWEGHDLMCHQWGTGEPFMKMDGGDAADLWALVQANDGIAGYLFSSLEDGRPYGRRGLERDEFDTIVAARAKEFPRQ